MDQTYGNALRDLITNPGSFQGTPGFQFALNNGIDAVSRAAAARGMNNSGNVLGDISKYATGQAQGNYMDYAKLLGGLSGQEEQYGLGERAANTADYRAGNDFTLGMGRLGLDRQLGMGNLALGSLNSDRSYGLGLMGADTAALRANNDFTLGSQRNAIDQSQGQNQFNLGMYQAQTGRGNALADIYYRNQGTFPHTFNTPSGMLTTTPRFG